MPPQKKFSTTYTSFHTSPTGYTLRTTHNSIQQCHLRKHSVQPTPPSLPAPQATHSGQHTTVFSSATSATFSTTYISFPTSHRVVPFLFLKLWSRDNVHAAILCLLWWVSPFLKLTINSNGKAWVTLEWLINKPALHFCRYTDLSYKFDWMLLPDTCSYIFKVLVCSSLQLPGSQAWIVEIHY